MKTAVTFPAAFSDLTIEEQFSKEGYVVVPFLEPHEVEKCRKLYFDTMAEFTSVFFTSALLPDGEARRKVREGLQEVVAPHVAPLLPDYADCIQHFVVKQGGPNSTFMPLHQDFSFADVALHRCFQVWIALEDVDEHNGCLTIVPGSHLLGYHISAMGLTSTPYEPYREMLERDCQLPIPMKAGEAVLFDARTLHGSYPNNSSKVRLGIAAMFLPAGLKQHLYVAPDPSSPLLDVIEVEDENVLDYGVSLCPPYPEGLKKIGTVEYTVEPFASEAIARLRRYPRKVKAPNAGSPRISPMVIENTKRGFLSRIFGQRS